jgi:hypothetical protein
MPANPSAFAENSQNDRVAISRVYLDNVITCGWVLKDLRPPEEMAAVERIYALHDNGAIKIVTSKMSAIEQARTADVSKRDALAAASHLVSVVPNDHRLLGFNTLGDGVTVAFTSHPMLSDIVDVRLFADLTTFAKLAVDDAKHVMYAVANDCPFFVTMDTKDLLPKRRLIEGVCPQLKILWPTEAVAALQA